MRAYQAAALGLFDHDLVAGTMDWDARVREFWGVEETPVPYGCFRDGVHPDDREALDRELASALDPRGTGRYSVEYRVVSRADGATRWVQVNGAVAFSRGRARRIIGTVQETTRAKAVEAALKESEERLRLGLEWARAAAWEWDMRANHVVWSPEYYALLGFDPKIQPSFESFVAAIHPESRAAALAEFEVAAARGGPFEIEFRVVRPNDGKEIWVTSTGSVEHDEGGRPVLARGINRDVSAWHEAQCRLVEQEAELRLVTDNAPVDLVHCDADERYVFVNRSYAERMKLAPEAIVGKRVSEVIGEDAYATTRPYVQAAIAGRAQQLELTIPYRSGTRVMHLAYEPEPGPEGSRRGFVVALQDVTERREAEEALRHRESELQSLADNSPDMLCRFDRQGRYVFVNAATERALGYAGSALLGKTPGELTGVADEERIVRWKAGIRKVFDTAQTQVMDVEIPTRAGPRSFAARLVPEFGPDGTVERVLSIARDVTEAKLADEALRASEERLRLATDAGGIGIWMWVLPEDRVTWENAQPYEIFGISREEGPVSQARFLAEFVDPTDAARLKDAARSALESGTGFHYKARIRRTDGRLRWVEFTGRLHGPSNGSAHWLLGTVADVTDRERVVEQVRAAAEANAKFRTMFEQGAQFACILALDGTVMEASRLCVDGCGFRREEIIGRNFWECGWWNRSPELIEMVHAAVASAAAGGPHRTETRYFLADGSERFLDLTVTPVTGDTGQVLFVVPTGTDITDRKRAEEILRDADRRKDDFLATLAHELRNPLAPIRTGLEVIKRSAPNSDAAAKARNTMERQLGHMVRLIDDLLDLSRIARGKVELRRQRLDLKTVIENALETSNPVIAESHHELNVSLPDETIWLDADLTRLAQVVSNILSNAAKYTPENGMISLTAQTEGEAAVIRVTDTGIGIPRDKLGSVFDMFAQVGTRVRDRSKGGLGIGLALVRFLVEMHGGAVKAESAGLGHGSTFTVRLPLAVAPKLADRIASGRSQFASFDPARKRVLVVDDNVDGADMLAAMLDLAGHEARTANDGPEALAKADEFLPEVVFLDIGLPNMDGHEVARRLRNDPKLADTVLVALTGWGSAEDKRRTHAAGFDFHLTKPVEPNAVESVLAKADSVRHRRSA